MEENENASAEQQNEQEIERLRNTIAAFKEYDKERKGYINRLLKQIDELSDKLKEEQKKSAILREKSKELQTIIQESKDANRVQQYRSLYSSYAKRIELLNKSEYDELVALTENHWEEIKKFDLIKQLRGKIKRQKKTINHLWSLLCKYRNEDGTLPGQTIIQLPDSLRNLLGEDINDDNDDSDDIEADYNVDEAIDEWFKKLGINE